jgi:hypothetical protein
MKTGGEAFSLIDKTYAAALKGLEEFSQSAFCGGRRKWMTVECAQHSERKL